MRRRFIFALILLLGILSSCSFQQKFVGSFKKLPDNHPSPEECRYCITTDDGEYSCGAVDISKIDNPDLYINNKVIIYGRRNKGPALTKCPILINADKIELFN